ncbi:MAG TPA: thioredoxin [Acidimicrobiales bacterium]|nr:thioredoxin [Acidimicrobiales bacterium]
MTDRPAAAVLQDGLTVVVKRECPTCTLVAPVLAQLDGAHVYSQDDPGFPEGVDGVIDDTDLAFSWFNDVETVPTVIRAEGGEETGRIVGWDRGEWEAFTGVTGLGPDLPDWRPGCGSRSVDPDLVDELRVRFEGSSISSRRVELASLEDEMEAMFDRGWTDGLPVVPPTAARVLAMLAGTDRAADDVVAVVPPDLAECTVEKVAINAVMAGCKPEYLPVVLAAVEAACTDTFNMHGLLATTYFSGPVIVVNGPIARAIGMNAGVNAFGQGNRANLTIGRALQLVVKNVGGGEPGGVDRATMGSPGKLSFCFAEVEDDAPWEPLAQSRGVPAGTSAVTLFAGHGPTAIVDQLSRHPDSLARSFAGVLSAVAHPKLALAFDAMLVVSPEHGRVFAEGGWDRQRLVDEITAMTTRSGADMVRGAGEILEGLPEGFEEVDLPKFRPGGLLVAHAGGGAGLFSAIIGGWVSGETGSEPVTVEVRS